MSVQHDTVALAVDDLVRGVAGVEDLYSARPLLARAARRLVVENEPLTLVQNRGAVLEVTVSIAVAVDGDAAADIAARAAQAAHDAVVEAVLPEAADARVRVRVSRVLTNDPTLPMTDATSTTHGP